MKKICLAQVKSCDTMAQYLQSIQREFAGKPAVSCFTRKKEEVCHSYDALTERVSALRAGLLAAGMGGIHIALVGENSYDWIAAFLAITACGSVAVCIDIEQSDEGIREMVTLSDAQVVFASSTFLPICAPLEGETQVRALIPMGDAADQPDSIEALCLAGGALAQPPALPAIDPHQTAAIVFTSGTTSRSKLVMLSHKSILQNICDSIPYVSFGDAVFCSLPFYHAYGLTCSVLGSLLRGTHLYINGDLKTAMRDLKLAQPDTMLTVPLMLEAIYQQMWLRAEQEGSANRLRALLRRLKLCRRLGLPLGNGELVRLKEAVVGTLHTAICGGAHLSREISEDLELFGILVLQGYGITECSPLISVNLNQVKRGCKMGSVGVLLPSNEAKVVNGEIWVRGGCVMNGYYKAPELTAEAMEDGWFKTGDIGYLDPEGFLYLTGRQKNLIVFKNGKKLSPEKLEELIVKIPLVKEVLVYGTANGDSTDDVKLTASIFPDPLRAQGLSSYEILEALQTEIDHINAALPTYQQVQMINIREREFAKTASKKIKRELV